MPRIQPRSLSPEEREATLNFLWSSISSLSDTEEVKNFLKEILSESEALMLSRRIQVASLLLKDDTCDGISEKIGVGKSTITSVNRWLKNIDPEKEKLIKKLEKDVQRKEFHKKKMSSSNPYSFDYLKRKYPLYFLLFNLMDEINFQVEYKKGRKERKKK